MSAVIRFPMSVLPVVLASTVFACGFDEGMEVFALRVRAERTTRAEDETTLPAIEVTVFLGRRIEVLWRAGDEKRRINRSREGEFAMTDFIDLLQVGHPVQLV